ncbi:MAG: diaminopimelate epimerase [Pirellulales bacterium]
MKFTKMQGAGNDYVYIDCFEHAFPADPAELARTISDRHFGVGGDGLIFICPSPVADARMRMFNADGSEAEMCGNGVRCVAKYVYDHDICRAPKLKIETGRGVLTLDVELKDERVERVRVDMGEPILEAEKIPTTLPGERIVDYPMFENWPVSMLDECGLDPRVTCVSMGNPHLILYCEDVARAPVQKQGPEFERATVFPQRINVHWVQVHSPREVTMRTWERGSGITLACGTGASAVCVAGVLTGRTERKILAHLPGGDLELEWSAENNHVYMTGPAVEVFTGEWKEV